jgi:CRISPR-associated protein Csx10
MNALMFQIRTRQPLLVAQLGSGEENSSTAYNFIPGSVLRGVAISRYLETYEVADAAQDPVCRHLFFDGAVRYLNAYPASQLDQRTLPKPLSWRVNKDDQDKTDAKIFDFAIEFSEDVENPAMPSGTYCWSDENDDVWIYDPARYISMQNASNDRNIKRENDSTVFRYDAIAAGEIFFGIIIADDTKDIRTLVSLLNGADVSLGGSRSAGFGRVSLEKLQIVENWREYEQSSQPDGGVVVITLLSDAILHDRNGNPTVDMDTVIGSGRLKVYQKTRFVGGFNRKWGLPLTQSIALQAGSVFVYAASEVDQEALKRLENDGIGERRTEGFGRIAINWHTQTEFKRRSFQRETFMLMPVPLSKVSLELGQRMANKRLRSVLDHRLLQALSGLRINDAPKNAQLSRLRRVVRHAWREKKPALVITHLDNLKAAKSQFESANVDNHRLLPWLIAGIEKENIWDNYLKPSQLPTIAGISPVDIDVIKVEYTMRFLDALLQRTAKEERSEGVNA